MRRNYRGSDFMVGRDGMSYVEWVDVTCVQEVERPRPGVQDGDAEATGSLES